MKLHLFKIACLRYDPNPVNYQSKLVDRKEMLSLQKVVSQMALQQLKTIKEIEKSAIDTLLTEQDNKPLAEKEESKDRSDG